jgi:hypothetical protein
MNMIFYKQLKFKRDATLFNIRVISNEMTQNEQQKIPHHTHGTRQNFNWKILERGKIDTHSTHIHDRSPAWLGTCTSMKSGGVKLVLLTETFPLIRAKSYMKNILMKIIKRELWINSCSSLNVKVTKIKTEFVFVQFNLKKAQYFINRTSWQWKVVHNPKRRVKKENDHVTLPCFTGIGERKTVFESMYFEYIDRRLCERETYK